MIEYGLVQVDDNHVPAFMIFVAVRALNSLRFGQAPVEAGAVFKIFTHAGMTTDTKFELGLVR